MEMVENYKRMRPGLDLLHSADTRAARINSIPVTKNTTPDHWMAIVLLTAALVQRGEYVINEARFRNGGRADIYLPLHRHVIEVLHSESLEQFEAKCKKHYCGNGVSTSWITTHELKYDSMDDVLKVIEERRMVRG